MHLYSVTVYCQYPTESLYSLVSAEDLPLAPGFTTTTTGYDPPSFYSSSEAGARLYGAPEPQGGYRDQDLYTEPGYQGRGQGGQTYSLYPGSQGLSVDLPSPDSGLGSDQVRCHPDQVLQRSLQMQS